MLEVIYNYINPIILFSNKEKRTFEDAFTFRQVPKKCKLTKEGKIAQKLYCVLKGLVQLYYTKDDQEISGYVLRKGLFASSYEFTNNMIRIVFFLTGCGIILHKLVHLINNLAGVTYFVYLNQ
ncbi:MAG: hypothetical protein INR73_25295 [Williamsia sp.]|nr:hypothetical protein [Williamsia sp.]